MKNDHQLNREVSNIAENLKGINKAVECLTVEIRNAKKMGNDAAYKLYWDQRETLFKKAVELQHHKETIKRSLFLAGEKILSNELEESFGHCSR